MTQTPAFPAARPIARRPATEAGLLGRGSPLLREPVVLTDGMQLMTEVWRWTPAFLREAVGTVPLSATLPGADGKFRYEPGRMPDAQPLTVAQFFDDMADPDGPRWCMQQVALERDLPTLAARLDYPSCVPRELLNAVNIWFAAPDTTTPLHYDDTHNLFAQVSGSKTFYLFPPENLDALYPGPLNTGAQHVSRVDMFHPDLAHQPLAASLSYRSATVHAGEALVLPAFWWHQVASHDLSVSVNFWWRAHVEDCLCPGFMRELQSATMQQDLSALNATFEITRDAEDPVEAAVWLVRLLADIGEHRAAAALGLSVLRDMQRRDLTAAAAAELLARYAGPGDRGSPGAADAGRLADELAAVLSRGVAPGA